MKFNLQVNDGPTSSTLGNETWLNGVQLLNVEQVRYLFNKHEILLKIRVPDLTNGKMRLKEFTLPQEQTQLLELNDKLKDLAKLLVRPVEPIKGDTSDDSGRETK